MRRSGNRTNLVVVLILSFIFLVFPCCGEGNTYAEESEYTLKIHFIDVGQGDCSFIELPDGKTMLIDAGTESNGKKVVKYIKKLGYKKIDYLIASHADGDHVGGLAKVIESLDVAVIYRPFVLSTNTKIKGFSDELIDLFGSDSKNYTIDDGYDYANFLNEAYNESVGDESAEIRISSDKEIILSEDSANPYMIKFFMPKAVAEFSTERIKKGYTTQKENDDNDCSSVVEIITDKNKYLFMGDLTAEKEIEMISALSVGDRALISGISVLKVGHHGSNTSSCPEFLSEISPAHAILSFGAGNEYGHPHHAVISSLEDIGSKVYKTGELGTIIVLERNSILYFENIPTESFVSKYDYIFYILIALVVIGIILTIYLYPKFKKKNKENKKDTNTLKI